MFGAFLDAAMSIPRFMHDEDMQNDAQAFASGEAGVARDFNSAQAVVARDWTERMANTQHQRGVADMRAAGLNPILAVRQGGAHVGSAAQAAAGGGASAGISNSGTAGTNFAAAQVMEDQKDNIRMDTDVKQAQRSLTSQQYNESQARTGLINQQYQTEREATRRESADADTATSNAKGRALEGGIDETTYGEIMRYIDRAIDSVSRGAGAIGNIMRRPQPLDPRPRYRGGPWRP